jgi:hypothetical protein
VIDLAKLFLIGTAFTVAAVPALAVEGALGRTQPGVWVMPQAGVVGPTPGFSFTLMPCGYTGSISGSREVPIAGSLVTNISADASFTYLMPQYVYKTEIPKVSFSSSFLAPVTWIGATGTLQLNAFTRSNSNANAGLSDVIISPLTVGIHFSDTNSLAIGAMIFAPTGAFTPGNLSNLGMGEWTVMPNLAHTILWEKRGLELDNFVGFDIYSQNQATKYTSGTVFHWDGMLMQYLSKRFGFGAIVSNITQITNDTGHLANVLHGFEGRAWGAGPVVLYVAKAQKPGVTVQFRWVPEFAVTNLMKGSTLLLGLTLQLN